jgi:hypothetical protein
MLRPDTSTGQDAPTRQDSNWVEQNRGECAGSFRNRGGHKFLSNKPEVLYGILYIIKCNAKISLTMVLLAYIIE